MADVKDQEFIACYTVEDDVGIAEDWYAAMSSIVDEAADLREEFKVSTEDLIAPRTLTTASGLRSLR
jgi:hypothetical protein